MKRRLIIGTGIVVALGAATALAISAPAAAVRPGEAVGLLDSSPRTDAPQLDQVEAFRLQPDSVRFAGDTATQRFWVAVDLDGKVCVVTAAGSPETAGAACAPAEAVKSSGVMLGLLPGPTSGVGEYVVYLLPDTADGSEAGSPWTAVGGNIVVADADAVRSSDIVTVDRSDGGVISLTG